MREVLPDQILSQAMGWPDVELVWMPEWLKDQDVVLDRLVEAVDRAATGTGPGNGPTESLSSDIPIDEGAPHAKEEPEWGSPDSGWAAPADLPELSGGASGTVEEAIVPTPPESETLALPAVAALPVVETMKPVERVPMQSRMERLHGAVLEQEEQGWDRQGVAEFRAWPVRIVGTRAMLDLADTDSEARGFVHETAREICAAEYPIEQRRFRAFVCNAFDLTRMKGTREEQLKGVLRRSGCATDRWGFVWPSDVDQAAFAGYRRFALDFVDIDQIHPRELDNLLRAVVT